MTWWHVISSSVPAPAGPSKFRSGNSPAPSCSRQIQIPRCCWAYSHTRGTRTHRRSIPDDELPPPLLAIRREPPPPPHGEGGRIGADPLCLAPSASRHPARTTSPASRRGRTNWGRPPSVLPPPLLAIQREPPPPPCGEGGHARGGPPTVLPPPLLACRREPPPPAHGEGGRIGADPLQSGPLRFSPFGENHLPRLAAREDR